MCHLEDRARLVRGVAGLGALVRPAKDASDELVDRLFSAVEESVVRGTGDDADTVGTDCRRVHRAAPAATAVAIGARACETWRRCARRARTWRTSRYGDTRIVAASVTTAAAAANASTRVTRSANGPASISAKRTVPAHASSTGGPAT